MRQYLKLATLLSILFLTFSIAGCGTSAESTKDTKPVEDPIEVVKEVTNESKTVDEQDQVSEETPNADTSAAEESEQPNTATTQSNQKTSTNGSSGSNNSGTTTSKSSTASTTTTTKPAQPSNSQPAAGTTSTPPTTTPVEEQKPVATVTISIVGPKDRGTILGATKMTMQEGDTILTILSQAAKKHNIQIETRGSGSTAYVEGIDHIYEFDYGMKSGWVFSHNGASITKSIGVIHVKDGDRIECYYTE
ncbi:DUF4430 domain-containing protein [Bacillus sp. MRMR6]|uniref:DUF4430 domain-containing protein n=1 Tax=Bacillus sp. MRMR6 TaxID=1928617 RepID=UPI0009521CE0|nr:DUF4430 domain-containing protein [Bacillus sp. MRMR6]OLS40313.1 hypothetical protein BTR25_09095 [Bacillus sp. MRMR6]